MQAETFAKALPEYPAKPPAVPFAEKRETVFPDGLSLQILL
jgi:hypothetical protein